MAEETVRRKSKDSVFVDLFQDVENVVRLYKDLYPDDPDITAEDIDITTIHSVMVNTQYNDLGFLARGKLIVLVEAQSCWNPNIALRMMFYLSETYRRYLSDTKQNEHSGSRVKLPRPDLYVVYSGEEKVPDEASLCQDYFGGESPVDVRVKVLCQTSEAIYGQYIGYCKVFDAMKKIYDNRLECVRETIRICKEKGYLADYLAAHEKEAITMMSE